MILGIDPGLANTGWAVIGDQLTVNSDQEKEDGDYRLVECGVLKTKIGDGSGERLAKIYDEIERLIKKYQIREVAVESLFFAKNAKSAIKVAEAIGVIKVCSKRCGIDVFEYTPLQVKMSLVGYGRAEKDQVEMMVRNYLKLDSPIVPGHASDAVAVGLTHLFTNREIMI